MVRSFLIIVIMLMAVPSHAGEADVTAVTAQQDDNGTWRFNVTVMHDDEGWDHYADQWQVLQMDRTIIGTRELAHPHVNEQPFTRSLNGVTIPDEIDRVVIRARDSVHGYGGKELIVELTR